MGAMIPVLSIAGTVLQAGDLLAEGRIKEAEAKDNLEQARRAAADALHRGNLEASRARMAGSQLVGRQKVAYAAGGVDLQSGTPLEVMTKTAGISELDALTLENNAAREAWGFRKQAQQIDRQAQLDRQRRQGQLFSTVLGGAGRAFGGM